MPTLRTKTGEIVLVETLISASTSGSLTTSETLISPERVYRSFMASVNTGAATLKIQVSNDAVVWLDYASLSPSTGAPDGLVDECPWPFVRAVVSANTGELTVTVGC